MAAAAAAAPSSGGTGNNNTAAATTTTSRFAAACGALSQYVKATAEADRTRARPPVMRPLPLMPGADVDQLEEPAETAAAAQLTIVYGGRALVLDDVTADRAADLLRLAAAAVARGGGTDQQPLTSVAVADLPVARKASLQRFMEKRKGRVAARAEAPYRRPAGDRRDDLTLAL